MRREIAGIGAGVLGLTAALRLAERGHAVTVFERESEPGGLPRAPCGQARADLWLARRLARQVLPSSLQPPTATPSPQRKFGLTEALDWRRPLTVTLRGGQFINSTLPLPC